MDCPKAKVRNPFPSAKSISKVLGSGWLRKQKSGLRKKVKESLHIFSIKGAAIKTSFSVYGDSVRLGLSENLPFSSIINPLSMACCLNK